MSAPVAKQFDFFHKVNYKPGSDLSLHLVIPKDAPKPMPLVILVHGGAWWKGSKDGPVLPLGMDIAGDGYAIASVSYTFSTEAPFPAAIEDVKCAIRFLRTNADEYGIDPNRIGALGTSAGGHLVSLAGTAGPDAGFDVGPYLDVSSKLQAVVDVCGPTNFPAITKEVNPEDLERAGPAYYAFLAGPEETMAEREYAASPKNYVSPDSPPFLVIHGCDDPVVPIAQGDVMVEALKLAGVECEYRRIPGATHDVFYPRYDDNLAVVLTFFGKHL